MDLRVNGGSIVIQRDLGTPSDISNILALNNIISGANLTTTIVSSVNMRFQQRSTQLTLASLINNIKLGSVNPSKIYLGSSLVNKIYLGTNLVYQS